MTDRPTLEADLERYRQSGDVAAQAETLFALAEIAYEEQEYNIAQGLYGQAWAAYEQVDDQKGLAHTMLGLGWALDSIFWNYTNLSPIPPEFRRADINLFYKLALGLYIAINNIQGQAEAYTAMGHEAFDTTEVERAQANYKLALGCYEALEDIRGQADTLQNMGQRYDYSDPECRLVYERALKLYQKLGDQRNEALCVMYLGYTAEREHDYRTARHNLEYAHTIFLLIGDTEWTEITHSHLEDLKDEMEPERIYRKDCERVAMFLDARKVPLEMIALWEKLAIKPDKNAAQARLIMQSLLAHSVKIHKPELQARLYWHWGRMEYYCYFCREMGIALCQWAVSLMQTDALDPDLVMSLYQEPLNQMRRGIPSNNPIF